jgi:uncharacterized protein DUF4007
MRFGGHETFAIREGWLHKGLMLLSKHPERVDDEYVADWLGVGRNMAKSIKHWLLATGLAKRPLLPNSRKRGPMELTRLGQVVLECDPYFLEKGTWFALHVNLVNNDEYAATWNWFFNHFLNVRFERATCNESLRRYLAARQKRLPSPKTLQRDLACLLASYAKDVPPTMSDPEDASDSPFRDLGLLLHFRDSGSFGRESLGPSEVPPELVPYALLMADSGPSDADAIAEVAVREACLMPGGPGRSFNMELEAFYELCVQAEMELGAKQFKLVSLAGERVIRFAATAPEDWLRAYYNRLERRAAA